MTDFFFGRSTGIFYPFTTVPTYIYTCMKFSKQSDNKYLYTVNTGKCLTNIPRLLIHTIKSINSLNIAVMLICRNKF